MVCVFRLREGRKERRKKKRERRNEGKPGKEATADGGWRAKTRRRGRGGEGGES
jgi:hypothetical protein